MKEYLKSFFEKRIVKDRPLLLGYSGGPDSKALFYLLLELRQSLAFDLHAVHLDHSWRSESADEAAALKKEVENFSIPFWLRCLDSSELPPVNREEHAREERLKFFWKISQEIGAQALILGHQADDLAETVLKRVFEGAHLRHMGGIQEEGEWRGMVIWRPLLNFRKKELQNWLVSKELIPLDDYTNRDARFLRGRMRSEIIPSIEKQFGKQIVGSLCRLGKSAQQLKSYFSSKLQNYFKDFEEGPWGKCWDLSKEAELHPLELEYLLKDWAQREQVDLTFDRMSKMIPLIQDGSANRQFECKGGVIYLDRKHLFLVRSPLVSFKDQKSFVETTETTLWQKPSQWKDLWRGRMQVCLPLGEYTISSLSEASDDKGLALIKKKRAESKVPAFLSSISPVILQNKTVVHDFLSGFTNSNINSKSLMFFCFKVII